MKMDTFEEREGAGLTLDVRWFTERIYQRLEMLVTIGKIDMLSFN
jgi:hypothetical protein